MISYLENYQKNPHKIKRVHVERSKCWRLWSFILANINVCLQDSSVPISKCLSKINGSRSHTNTLPLMVQESLCGIAKKEKQSKHSSDEWITLRHECWTACCLTVSARPSIDTVCVSKWAWQLEQRLRAEFLLHKHEDLVGIPSAHVNSQPSWCPSVILVLRHQGQEDPRRSLAC